MHRLAPARPVATALLAALLALLAPGTALAQPQDPDNAATWYTRAITALAGVDARHQNVIGDWDRRTPPTRALRAALRAHAQILDLIERGTDCRRCDFELDYDAGWELLLPHLGRLRQCQRTLAARAAVSIFEGRGRAATTDIERIHRIAYHVAGDDLLISSLVAIAGSNMAEELVDLGFRRGVFGPQEAADLLGITKELISPDAFRLRNAVATERRINSVWLRDRLVNGSVEDRVELMSMLGMDGLDEAEAERVRETPTDEVIEQLDLLDASYGAIDESFANMYEDPEEALASFEAWREELVAGTYGELSQQVIPAFGKVLEQGIRMNAELEERRAMLEAVIRGDAGAIDLDGAVHLREAMARVAQIPVELADLVAVGGEIPQVDDEASAASAAWDAALEQLAAAAAADGFDLGVLRVEGDSIIVPAWAAQARRTLRMLAGTARQRRDAGQPEEAARLATIGVRIAGHLAGTEAVLASRLAQEHLDELTPLIGGLPAAVRGDAMRAAGEQLVMTASATGSPKQESSARLGYPAIDSRLTMLGSQAVADLRARSLGAEPQWAGQDEEVGRLDLDQCVILLLATERVAGAVYGAIAPPKVAVEVPDDGSAPEPGDGLAAAADALPDTDGLEGLVDAAAMAALEARVPEIRRRLAMGEEPIAAVIGSEPSPLDLRPHARTAGEVIRALHRAIDPEHRWTADAADAADAGIAAPGEAGA